MGGSRAQDDGQSKASARALAVAEVLLAFVLMHLSFRAIKRWSAWGAWEAESGAQYSPGLTMLVVGGAFLVLGRRSLGSSGLRPWAPRRALALSAWTIVLLTIGTGLAMALGLDLRGRTATPTQAASLVLIHGVVTWLVLLRGEGRDAVGGRACVWLGVLLAVGVPVAWFAIGMRADLGVGTLLTTVAWIGLASALGEEFFFRGYLQTRLNECFGRPFEVCGVCFGWGLPLAAGMFGLVHLLNPWDYFEGPLRLAPWHAVATGSTLFYGALREKTGSIWAGVLVHGLMNLGARASALALATGV